MFIFAVIFTACGSNQSLSNEEIISKLENHADEVDSYHAEININVDLFEDGDAIQNSSASLKVDMIESTMESSGEIIEESDGAQMKTLYYSTEGATYANMNDEGWQDFTAQQQIFQQNDSTYPALVKLILDIKDEDGITFTDDGDHYVLSFNDKSQVVFEAFEAPYSLSVVGFDSAEMEHDLNIYINQDTFYINHLQYTVTGEHENYVIEMGIDHKYENMNGITEIEIPQEVIDEASM